MKQQSFTQSMSWLHTWSGLIAGWILFAIFLTGTIAVFDTELTRWLKPEIPESQNVTQVQAAQTALAHLEKDFADKPNWQVNLPNHRSPELAIAAGTGEGRRAAPGSTTRQTLDPVSAEVHEPRSTAGGNFFFRFHFTLHMPRNLGIWVVAFFGMAMLVTIVSGIVIHKKIFKEFFTFRPNKGQRSWLDAHNASAVLLMPFHIMIAYTGITVFMFTYIPSARDLLAPPPAPQVQQQAQRGAEGGQRGERPEGQRPEMARGERPEMARGEGRGDMTERGEARAARGEGRGERRTERAQIERQPYADIAPILAKAEADMGEIAGFSIEKQGTPDATISVRPMIGNQIALGKGRSMSFNAYTGELIKGVPPLSNTQLTHRVFSGLHFAQFGGYSMRWLYFVCGLVSSFMMAMGLVVFVVKRRRQYHKETPVMQRSYRVIESLNIAAIVGVCLGSIGLMWANRLLPVEMAERDHMEINVFFGMMVVSFIWASLRKPAQAWVEQLWLLAAMLVLTPVLSLLTVAKPFADSIMIATELTCVGLGLIAAFAAVQAKRSLNSEAKPARKQAKPQTASKAPAAEKEEEAVA